MDWSAAEQLLEYTPIRAPAGKRVHATSMRSPGKTVCGYVCDGWHVQPSRVNCHRCKAGLLFVATNPQE